MTPNPAARNISISYTLPEGGPVSLKLYDMTGRLVTTIASGQQSAGTHNCRFESLALPRGVYVLELETARKNASILTEKLIIE